MGPPERIELSTYALRASPARDGRRGWPSLRTDSRRAVVGRRRSLTDRWGHVGDTGVVSLRRLGGTGGGRASAGFVSSARAGRLSIHARRGHMVVDCFHAIRV